jgi:hypothetical protein
MLVSIHFVAEVHFDIPAPEILLDERFESKRFLPSVSKRLKKPATTRTACRKACRWGSGPGHQREGFRDSGGPLV